MILKGPINVMMYYQEKYDYNMDAFMWFLRHLAALIVSLEFRQMELQKKVVGLNPSTCWEKDVGDKCVHK